MRPKISEKEIGLRKRYAELTEEDVALLREVQPIVTAHLDELVEAFYSHLLHFEETRKILKDEATVNRLKDAQKRYLMGLFTGDYGPEYVESRFRIGEVHYRIGLGIKWYLGAVHRYEWQLVGLIRKHTQFDKDKLRRVGRAICSILYFDTQWALETYELAYTEELRNKIKELRIHAHQQEAVAKIGMRALAVSDLSTLMDEAVAIVAETLGVEYCKVLELLPDKKALLLRAGVGWKVGLVGHATVGTGTDSQAGHTLLSNEPVIVEDLRMETRFSGPPLLRDHGVVSGVSVIIQTKDGPFGVLGAHTTRQRTFTRDNSNFLQAIANVIAAAIERKQLQEHLDYAARYDALTGLPNRVLFLDLVNKAVAHAKREKLQMAVLLIYIDRLESICGSLGHTVCDSSFKAVAKYLTDSVRMSDTVARLGREEDAATVGRMSEHEFAVLLPEINGAHDAAKVAQRILDAFSKDTILDDKKFALPCSVGISIYPSCGDSGETLLKSANIAMSHIKKEGKSDFQFYSPEVGVGVSERIALEDDLRKALERKELLVYYQPAVDLATGQITGMEALVRWRHPERGLVSPGKFIPLVEEMGLIIPIGELVLRTACIQNRAWYDAGLLPIRISVNFSTYQFRQQNVIELITRAVKETGLDPHYLELEITESALMEAKGVIVATLLALKEMGMGISIDDFGTGYSSLSKLKHLPIDKLKVDQSFVRDVTIHPDDDAIVSATIAMAHSLRLKVVAEGVETPQQLEFLRSLKCDEMQGYLFSPPLPAEEATKLLAEGKRLEL